MKAEKLLLGHAGPAAALRYPMGTTLPYFRVTRKLTPKMSRDGVSQLQ